VVEQGADDGEEHPQLGEEHPSPGSLRVAQPAQAEDEEDRGEQIEQLEQVALHGITCPP